MTPSQTSQPSSKPTILYVEDMLWDMEDIIENLSTDFNVVTSRNNDQALSQLIPLLHDNSIKLILMDIRLIDPLRLDNSDGRDAGFNFANLVIKKLNIAIPIIGYTANAPREITEKLLNIGVKEIVLKRTPMSELKTILWKYIR